MESTNLYKKDTQKIEVAYKIFQTINLISLVLMLLGGFIAFCAMIDEFESFALIPLGAALLYIPVYIITSLFLNIFFGMFYDIRKMRMNSDNAPQNTTSAPTAEDEIPDL